MYVNVNKKLIDINNIVNDLKEKVKRISDKFPSVKLKKQVTMDNLVIKYTNDKDFQKMLDNIKVLLDDICEKLELLESFKKEFHNFLSIQSMMAFIIEDAKRYISYFYFVKELTVSFCELITTKISLIKDNDFEKYDAIYRKFDENLFKQEEFFYLNICDYSGRYDKLIDEVTNILW